MNRIGIAEFGSSALGEVWVAAKLIWRLGEAAEVISFCPVVFTENTTQKNDTLLALPTNTFGCALELPLFTVFIEDGGENLNTTYLLYLIF